jgi:Ca2+-binding EF-hand superfamily protein
MRIRITDDELKQLIDAVDTDQSGKVEFEEFVQMLRDPLTPRRLALVDLAYSILDVDGNGIVDAAEVASAYTASKHPAVMTGSKSVQDVMAEFLDTFDVGGEVDGKVTRDEFINYYSNLSASIDNEDYFELMIRNAWHISGGQGQAANSANRRVLVTDSQGKQSVQEIKQDMGLRQDDKAGMVARLRAQGVDAAKIDTTGSNGDKKAPKVTPEMMKEVNDEVSELRKEAFKLYASQKHADAEQLFNMIMALLQSVHSSKMHPEIYQTQKSIDMCRQKMEKMGRP